MPTLTTLSPLSPSDLFRILTEVHGSLVSQYTALFGYSGVEIRFTSAALREICRKAAERGGGARGLRGIMVCSESHLATMFLSPLLFRKPYYWMLCMKFRKFISTADNLILLTLLTLGVL